MERFSVGDPFARALGRGDLGGGAHAHNPRFQAGVMIVIDGDEKTALCSYNDVSLDILIM